MKAIEMFSRVIPVLYILGISTTAANAQAGVDWQLIGNATTPLNFLALPMHNL